ncbi:MAG: ABC transporter related protein [Candidatus Uhrbacteria bacterium GW2011_GWE2_41_1153]|nr:MAG: ABC transporter related protein [Candidatus Uhrbacteria bacterium GW2011_GWE2_41_1153]
MEKCLHWLVSQGQESRVDGIDIRDLTLKSLRENVGFVMQENLLFHDSIINNIRLARPTASLKEVQAAAKRAQAHNFIKGLPKGYNSIVGERGVKLSGGEKQRIALARVLLEDPPILVLDEATSALDSKTEHDLQAALKIAMTGRSTIVIAHRLSTVMDADQILVMDKGKIVAQGTHEELIKTCAIYKEFWTIQAGGYV